MCCILACMSARPTFTLIKNIASTNKDGLGVAWIDRKSGKVKWVKGLKEEEAFNLTVDIPLPFMVHARWATVGGASPRLTHPFPIERKPSLDLTGSADKVLMHNGHLGEWEQLADRIGLSLPNRPFGWSDSRVIASAVHFFGKDVLKVLDPGRFALLSASEGLEMFGSWIKESEGIFASSSTTPSYGYGGMYGGFCGGVYDSTGDDEMMEYYRKLHASDDQDVPSQARRMRFEMDDATRIKESARHDTEEGFDFERAKRIHEIDDEWWMKIHGGGVD